MKHGTIAGYTFHGCRCDLCRAENSRRVADWRRRRHGKPPKHGTLNGYQNYGCRCEPCRTARYRRYLSEPVRRDGRDGAC